MNFMILWLGAVLIPNTTEAIYRYKPGEEAKFSVGVPVPAFKCAACQAVAPAKFPNIIGGEPASEAEFPYYAKLSISNGGYNYLCGATLISREYVITAAHCVLGADKVTVELGRTTPGSTSVVYEDAYRIRPHTKYNSTTLVNDIAILKIPKVTFNEAIAPLCLPENKKELFENVDGIAIGFGLTAGTDGTIPDTLQKAVLTTASASSCTEKRICASHESRSICFGDSGSALIYSDSAAAGNETLIGISSYVSRSTCLGGYNGFTRVSAYLGWIANKARNPTC